MTQLPRGRHQLSRDEVVEAQRERMLRAMADAMTERGYVGTPVAEIIRRAGVSRETFYQQFSSKQDCFMAAFENALGPLADAMSAAQQLDGTPVERFDRVLGIYLRALALDPATARLFLIETYAAGPDVLRRRVEVQEQFVSGLAEIFQARSGRGRFACRALMSATITMATTQVASGDANAVRALRAPLARLAREMSEVLAG